MPWQRRLLVFWEPTLGALLMREFQCKVSQGPADESAGSGGHPRRGHNKTTCQWGQGEFKVLICPLFPTLSRLLCGFLPAVSTRLVFWRSLFWSCFSLLPCLSGWGGVYGLACRCKFSGGGFGRIVFQSRHSRRTDRWILKTALRNLKTRLAG